MLDPVSVVSYLLECGLLSTQSIIDSDLYVFERSYRNANFMVVSEQGPSYLVKQGLDKITAASVDHEAKVYEFLTTYPGRGEFLRCLPRCYHHDDREHIIVLEMVRGGENLDSRFWRVGRFSTALAAEVGVALALLHHTTRACAEGIVEPPRSLYLPPTILNIHRPRLTQYNSASAANIQLLLIAQQLPGMGEELDRTMAEWKADAFVHGDIKWANLVTTTRFKGKKCELKIVDWELAGVGDPCWDTGSIFSEYLSLWLRSIPITGKDPPERFLSLASYPLPRMQPAIRAFWHSYTSAMGLSLPVAAQWLMRAVKYCGARLVQTAFEEGQVVAELNGNIITLLQLALNVMRRPQQAASRLLGIPWQQVFAS